MYLKQITLAGFKSFPDRVVFDFSPGVTCVVGPNGCGKSNLVDAFKWVLGEQSARLLRGRQMVDMIFNGSESRRASGMAQVDLVFDNTRRMLPAEHDEIRITRKLYRSGESEYSINNEVTRLKDIRDLFMDTGIGADSYSIIEQGRVSRLLDATTHERRSIFEEAAGIGRYKIRKQEAERKLERTQQNLLRIDDIVEEVQRRLRSVKLQAGKARSFQEYDGRLKALRASFSLGEYRRLTETIARIAGEADATSDRSTSLRTSIDRTEMESAKLADTVNRLTENLSEAEREYLSTRSEAATQEERIESAARRIEEQRQQLERVEQRIVQIRAQQETQESRLGEAKRTADNLQQETRDSESRVAGLVEEDGVMARRQNEAESGLEDEKAGVLELMRRSVQLKNEIASLDAHRQKLEQEHERLGHRDAAIRAELEDYVGQQVSLETRGAEIDSLIAAQGACLVQKREEAGALATTRQELIDALAEAKEERSGLRSGLRMLDELQKKLEGVADGVKSLLSQKEARPDDDVLRGVRGMVGEQFDADVVYARVIEAAIGELDQYLVISDSAGFLTRRDLLDALPGRLNAVCLDRIPPVINEPQTEDIEGFVAQAADLVRCEEGFERLARHLLGKTVVVETLEHALRAAKDDTQQRRFVTLAGEVVEPQGAVSVGPPTSRAGLIARKSERRKLVDELAVNEERITTLGERLDRTAAEASHLETIQSELRGALDEAKNAKVDAQTSLERVNEAVRRLSQEQPLIAGEVTMVVQQIAESKVRANVSSQTMIRLEEESSERQRRIVEQEELIESVRENRERARYALTELQVTLGKLSEKRAATAETIHLLRQAIQESQDALERAGGERLEAVSRIESSERAIEEGRARLQVLGTQAERLEGTAVQLRRRREEVRMEAEKLSALLKTSRSQLEQIEARLHELELEKQRSVVHRDDLKERVAEELQINLEEMCATAEQVDIDFQAVEAEITELRQKIQRLGNVNLDAIDELAELEERDQFLTTQRQDLEDSRRQLEGLIAKLDAESLERFNRAFEAIREHFRELFRKLFGGGKADIILEDPNDPLGCGIDILAKPPGKELQRISLMSGGEKTMTAIALVMSIFRAQPSPFAFLDEVDAALDEANNVRFNNIIKEFLDKSQFIVVTHSKRTMSIADQLYGITMQEPGISARVSVRFERENERETSAVA